jgi:hypothetical protein
MVAPRVRGPLGCRHGCDGCVDVGRVLVALDDAAASVTAMRCEVTSGSLAGG